VVESHDWLCGRTLQSLTVIVSSAKALPLESLTQLRRLAGILMISVKEKLLHAETFALVP